MGVTTDASGQHCCSLVTLAQLLWAAFAAWAAALLRLCGLRPATSAGGAQLVACSSDRPALLGAKPVQLSQQRPQPLGCSQELASDILWLTRRITNAEDAEAVLGLLAEGLQWPTFNSLALAASIVKLAKLGRGIGEKVRLDPVLTLLAIKAETLLSEGKVTARELANMFWAVAKLGGQLPQLQQLLPALITSIPPLAGGMDPQHLANIIWGCAKLKLPRTQLQMFLPTVAERAAELVNVFKAQEVANVIWAAANMKQNAPEVLRVVPLLAEEVQKKPEEFKAQEVANIMWAAARLQWEVPELLTIAGTLVQSATRMSKQLNAQDVTNIVWAVGSLQPKAPELLTSIQVLVRVAMQRLPEMSPQAMTNTCWGLALCSLPDRAFMKAVVERVVASCAAWSERDACLSLPQVVWSCARLHMNSARLLHAVEVRTASLLRCMTDWSVAVLSWSYNVLDTEGDFKGFRRALDAQAGHRRISASAVERSQLGPSAWLTRP